MVKVEFLGPIAHPSLEIEAATLQEVASKLQKIEAVASWLPTCAVAINDELISDLNQPLKAGDRVSILPPVCGG